MNPNDGPDVVTLLREQHQMIRSLMATTLGAATDSRTDAFEEVLRLFTMHENAEEMVVHPALRRHAGDVGARVAAARRAEEDAARRALAELERLDTTSLEFLRKFTAFSRDVEHHTSTEEREAFPLLAEMPEAAELRDAIREMTTDSRRDSESG